MSGTTLILRLDSLAFGYAGAAPVFADVSLALARGAFVAIVGPSGVGKSSLLRVIAGLAPPGAGRVDLSSREEPGRRRTAMVFQDARLLPWRRVRGNVELGLEGLVRDGAERRRRADASLELVGLRDQGARWPHQLSGGQRQRVGIARALAVRPDLLLVDEPFGALDAITRDLLQDELLRLWQETGATVVFVTHDLAEAAYLADQVVVLGGAAPGTPAHIVRTIDIDIARPRRRSTPQLDARVCELRSALSERFIGGSGI